MVLSLCIEFRGPHIRPTGDADVAVGVFTHRHALRAFTAVLAQEGFKDVTPASADSESTSYRWRRDGLLIDVAVPPEVNEQRTSPTTINNREGLELPATQQAIRRTEAVDVEVAGERVGRLRRPNLLGAIVIKSTAAIVDSRDPERHHEDIVSLADIIALRPPVHIPRPGQPEGRAPSPPRRAGNTHPSVATGARSRGSPSCRGIPIQLIADQLKLVDIHLAQDTFQYPEFHSSRVRPVFLTSTMSPGSE